MDAHKPLGVLQIGSQLTKDCKLTVSAVNNAIKGNGSVTVKGDADVLVEGAEDAIKTDSLDVGKGFLLKMGVFAFGACFWRKGVL